MSHSHDMRWDVLLLSFTCSPRHLCLGFEKISHKIQNGSIKISPDVCTTIFDLMKSHNLVRVCEIQARKNMLRRHHDPGTFGNHWCKGFCPVDLSAFKPWHTRNAPQNTVVCQPIARWTTWAETFPKSTTLTTDLAVMLDSVTHKGVFDQENSLSW